MNFNYFNVYWFEEGWAGDHNISGSSRNFSAEIISPVPEPSTYDIGGAIAVLCCIVCHRRHC
jgi:hypothetical protein